MAQSSSERAARLAACECITPLGDAPATLAALLEKRVSLRARPALGADGGDEVPLSVMPGRAFDETEPPSWMPAVRELTARLPSEGWGEPRRPVFVTSSNFGVASLLAWRRGGNDRHLAFGAPFLCVEWLRGQLGWKENVTVISHACVSAHLGLIQASRAVCLGTAEAALVFSFDFLSPFVAGGFNALKILNGMFPAPYEEREAGAIGLGDGAAFAIVTRDRGDWALEGQSLFNEMHHFTANRPDGSGFAACLAQLAPAVRGRRVWAKGHGTGTLEAGRLEAAALAAGFPGAPLVGWKGSLGHTLGSCGLVELAIVVEAMKSGRTPGTVGNSGKVFTDEVALDDFDNRGFDGAVCTSNAFGGAHAALLVSHV
ncbi:MAG: hypothetical protein ACREIA_11820 [Opitutaceae bacterium]